MTIVYELAEVKDGTKVENAGDLAKLAAELGLEVQARRYSKSSVEDCFTPLTADERLIWDAYCPTAYWLKADPNNNKMISDYAFDTVPEPVLRHWKAIRDNFAFDNFMIKTTEKTAYKDPLLIGTHGENRYLLARWGQEAPDLVPLTEVAKRLLLRRVRQLSECTGVLFKRNLPNAVAHRMNYYISNELWRELAPTLRVLRLPYPLSGEDIKALIKSGA